MRSFEHSSGSSGRQRGLALILVLWVLTLLSLMAAGFLSETRTEVVATRNRAEVARAEALADAAVYWTIQRLVREQAIGAGSTGEMDRAPLPTDGRIFEWSFEGGAVRIAIRDEMGKIDINAAGPKVFAGLLQAVGVAPGDARALAMRILDFRDPDDLVRTDGAEDQAYEAAGVGYGAKDAAFQSIDEIGQVLGIDRALTERLRPHLTVASGVPGVVAEAATRAALLALPALEPAAVDPYILARAATAPGEPVPAPPPGPDYVRSTRTRYTITAEAHAPSGAVFVREARIDLDRVRADQPYSIERWGQRMSRLPAESADVVAARAAMGEQGR